MSLTHPGGGIIQIVAELPDRIILKSVTYNPISPQDADARMEHLVRLLRGDLQKDPVPIPHLPHRFPIILQTATHLNKLVNISGRTASLEEGSPSSFRSPAGERLAASGSVEKPPFSALQNTNQRIR